MAIENMGYLGFSVKDVPTWRSHMTNMLGMVEVDGSDHSALYRMDSVCLRWVGLAGRSFIPMDFALHSSSKSVINGMM
ncbi:hypothetical protein [Brevibacillus daliensis]|uniref:hypothetical protein n=1 Tax=Brevibacillus daliensis TaxID=2892995 RepID=UPI001E318F17|nr:hypothetical protein [Brevibacillus daliensis]